MEGERGFCVYIDSMHVMLSLIRLITWLWAKLLVDCLALIFCKILVIELFLQKTQIVKYNFGNLKNLIIIDTK